MRIRLITAASSARPDSQPHISVPSITSTIPYAHAGRSYVTFLERSPLASFQCLLAIQKAVQLDDFRHAPGPPGLMARTQSRSIVAVKVFIEQDEITPVGI
jgi:hypothetical protein